MHSANIQPPSYAQATQNGQRNTYNTQYSAPMNRPNNFSSPLQQPLGQPTCNPTNIGTPQIPVATVGQQISWLSRPENMELQRMVIMSIVCFFPLGICAWYEFKHAKEAYEHDSTSEAERHVGNTKRFAYIAVAIGLIVCFILVVNPFRIYQQTALYDHNDISQSGM